jgi:uncharacterized membrane protein YuzA (DUF378 family)
MAEKIEGLPKWFPVWLYHAIHTAWFCAIMMGLAGYFTLSLINDVLGTIPFWARVVAGVGSGLMVRLGIALEWRKARRESGVALEWARDFRSPGLFDVLIANGIAPSIAASAEHASMQLPRPDVQIRTLLSVIFWLIIVIVLQVISIAALLIALIAGHSG